MIPKYEEIMLPLLKYLSDGQEHGLSETHDTLARQFKLTDQELREFLPSGKQTIFRNRVGWARTYMKKAGLLISPKRAHFRISDKGKELLNIVKTCSPEFFEKLVIDLLITMGYGGSRKDAGQAMGKSGDGGIDGIINEDKLGLDVIYLQAKRWDNAVPVKEIRDFTGTPASKKAKKGIFITTSSFPNSVYEFVGKVEYKIILIDGERLTKLMIEHSIGLSTVNTYHVKTIDSDYFEEN